MTKRLRVQITKCRVSGSMFDSGAKHFSSLGESSDSGWKRQENAACTQERGHCAVLTMAADLKDLCTDPACYAS